jgi:hypothetical protein
MPALTHGRVRNGFNQYARSITYAQDSCKGSNGEVLECCKEQKQQNFDCGGQKNFCCGKPIQPTKYKTSSKTCIRGNCRVPTRESGERKRAIVTGGVGSRSFGTSRAIARRVQNRNQNPKGSSKWWRAPVTESGPNLKTGVNYTFGDECDKASCECCLPTFPSTNPVNVKFVKL